MNHSFKKTTSICSFTNANLEVSISRGKSYARFGLERLVVGVETVKDVGVQKESTKPTKVLENTRFLEAMSWVGNRHHSLIRGVGNCQRRIGVSPHRTFGRLGKIQ